MNNDSFAKASTNRYFPLSPSTVISAVDQYGFATNSYHERLPVHFENCGHVCALGHQLATLHRMGYLAIFSLPEQVASPLASVALQRAISVFSTIDGEPHLNVREKQFLLYRAFLGPLGRLNIVYDIISGGSRPYLMFKASSQLSKASEAHRKLLPVTSIQLA